MNGHNYVKKGETWANGNGDIINTFSGETGISSTHSLDEWKPGPHQHILWRNGDLINTFRGETTSILHTLNHHNVYLRSVVWNM